MGKRVDVIRNDKVKKEKTENINNIHDKFYRSVFSDPRVSIDLFKGHLPKKILTEIDFRTLQLANKSFVNEMYTDKHSDLIFKGKVKNGDGYVYVVCEHQSTNDRFISTRMREYTGLLIKQHMKEFRTNKAPVVINLLVYSGKSNYRGPRNFNDMYESPKFAKKVMSKNFYVVDLNSSSVYDLIKNKIAGLAEILLK